MATSEIISIGRRETIVEAIARALIDYIAKKQLGPGDQLPTERELAEMIGVSRLPLREALCMLKGLGVVEAKQGLGVFVKPLDVGAVFQTLSPLLKIYTGLDQDHIAMVRCSLEGDIAELAARLRSNDNLRAMREAIDQMWLHLTDRPAYIKYDMVFHQEMARAAGNPIFQIFVSSIADLFVEIQWLYPNRSDYFEESTDEHEHIFDAIRDGDAPGAKEAVRKHITKARKRL